MAKTYLLAFCFLWISETALTEETMSEKGARIVSTTASDIVKNLMTALNDQKTVGALAFCKEQAIPITRSHSEKLNATIKRATDRTRNPKNLADQEELKYIRLFKKDLAKGKPLVPILVTVGDEHHYYSPIVTNSLCLQCHGSLKTEIQKDVALALKSLYPKDNATGYAANELRGVFSVRWKSK